MKYLGLLILTFFSASALAWEMAPTIGGGFEFGGDKLVELTYSDGSKSEIKAGSGVLLYGGLTLTEGQFQFEPRLGIKWNTTKEAKNGSVDWIRVPVELVGFWLPVDQVRIGGGLTYQMFNKLKGSKDASPLTTDVENALGFLVEGSYLIQAARGDLSLGLRYTKIDYKAKLAGSKTVTGDSIGFVVGFTFDGLTGNQTKETTVE